MFKKFAKYQDVRNEITHSLKFFLCSLVFYTANIFLFSEKIIAFKY